jgi:putative endonuclease
MQRTVPSRQSGIVRTYWVYILSSGSGTLYVGVTSNLTVRLAEHRSGIVEGFTSKYAVHRLVYYEETSDVWVALAREKQIKGWSRKKKVELIRKVNPSWRDLSRGW